MISDKHRTSYIFDATISTCSIHWPQPNRASWDTSHSESQHAKHEVRQVEVKVGGWRGETGSSFSSPASSLLASKRGEVGMSAVLPGSCLRRSGSVGVEFTLWALPMWIFRPFSDLKSFPHCSHLKAFTSTTFSRSSSASSTETSCWDSPAAGAIQKLFSPLQNIKTSLTQKQVLHDEKIWKSLIINIRSCALCTIQLFQKPFSYDTKIWNMIFYLLQNSHL